MHIHPIIDDALSLKILVILGHLVPDHKSKLSVPDLFLTYIPVSGIGYTANVGGLSKLHTGNINIILTLRIYLSPPSSNVTL